MEEEKTVAEEASPGKVYTPDGRAHRR